MSSVPPHVGGAGDAATRRSLGDTMVKTALNTQKDAVDDLSRDVARLEKEASDLRNAVLSLLVDTATTPATSGKDAIAC